MFSAANVHLKQSSANTTFIFGGLVGGLGTNTNYINRFKSSVRTTDSVYFATGISGMSAAAINSKSYLFGGYQGSNQVNKIVEYTGEAINNKAQTLETTQDNSCAATLSNIAFIFGGHYVDLLTSIQRYNGSTRSTDSATLYQKRYQACCSPNTTLGVIFHFGGSNFTSGKLVERYDGSTRSTDSATLYHQLSLSSAGFIGANNYLMGGYDGWDDIPTNIIQKYTGTTMSTVSQCLYNRFDHSGSSMDNNVYKFGGRDSAYSYGTIERFDGVSDRSILESAQLVSQLSQTAATVINNIRSYA